MYRSLIKQFLMAEKCTTRTTSTTKRRKKRCHFAAHHISWLLMRNNVARKRQQKSAMWLLSTHNKQLCDLHGRPMDYMRSPITKPKPYAKNCKANAE